MNQDEESYLALLQELLEARPRPDRTGIGTRSLFGRQIRFSLRNECFPLLTTKRVFFRGVIEELGWFLRGETDANILKERGVHIWDGNTSREALDRLGFVDRPEGEAGPVYGAQWRNFGGVDQILWLIEQLRKDPTSRRHVLSAWNPVDLPNMCLPPCHVLYQFYVTEDRHLSCHVVMRSTDAFLGLPFNIASAAVFTHWMARVVGLTGGHELILSMGDVHLYENHLEVAREQIQRKPRAFPRILLPNALHGSMKILDAISYVSPEHIKVIDYDCHPTLRAPMAV